MARPIVRAGAASLSGVVAVAAALGAGHLAAGLVSVPESSPFVAVGNAAIDRTPASVKDFAIKTFGTADKPALLVGMAVVLALVGVAIGLVSRRSAGPGLVAITVLGGIGVLAVHEQSPQRIGLLAPLVALLIGLASFWVLHSWARPDEPAAGTTSDTAEQGSAPFARRPFLLGAAGVAAAAVAAGCGGALLQRRSALATSRTAIGKLVPTVPAPPIPPDAAFPELGTPTFLTPSRDFYRIDINLTVPQLRAEDAVLRITGLVDRELQFSFDEIRRMPLIEKPITMTCVSNGVGGPYVSTANFIGVPLLTLLDEAGVQPEATQLIGHSVDGFTLGTPLDLLRNAGDDALLAIGMNGEPLLPEHGFPMRTVVAGLYGYVSATKWLTELELGTYDFEPYWVQRGWDGQPPGVVPVKISSRIDAPESFQQVNGEVTVAGTAWAPGRGISRVEVRFDDGDWEQAQLSTEVSPNTWRMFRLSRSLAAGQHQVMCRAVDGDGVLQSEERLPVLNPGPVPDGAEGWHSIVFTVG